MEEFYIEVKRVSNQVRALYVLSEDHIIEP